MIGAVQLHSRYREKNPDNFVPYKIMSTLAWYANSTGQIGIAGNPRKCLGYRRIAAHACVHRNSVGKWIPLLCESGELSIVEHGGSGRGSWTVYQIHLPQIDDMPITEETAQGASGESDTAKETAQAPEETAQDIGVPFPQNDLVPIVAELAQAVEKMAHELAHVKNLMAQGNGTIGTSHQTEPSQYRSYTDLDPGGEESVPSPDSPEYANLTEFLKANVRGFRLPEDSKEQALIDHPATLAWLRATGHWPGYLNLEVITEDLGKNPNEKILKREWTLWSAKYSTKGRLNVRGILDWYRESLRKQVQGGHKLNGASSKSLSAWGVARKCAENGTPPDDPLIRKAVSPIWAQMKKMTKSNEGEFYNKFIQNYEELQ